MQQIIKVSDLDKDLSAIIGQLSFDKLFVLTDVNTDKLCYPLIAGNEYIAQAGKITIGSGETHKSIDTLSQIWHYLVEHGATRHSLLINLGGGMLTDIGGFAAACFKRGIKCINIPTTLLGAVDAAVGGKTGVNFDGLKNEIGAFAPAEAVLIDSEFFKTLNHQNLLSGYAEMIKHSLLDSDKEWKAITSFDTEEIDYERLKTLTFSSVKVKERIVEQDPFEKGIRKALNLGHTIGHAFESLSYEKNKPVQHGYAVAWGIVCELYLSHKYCHFPKEKFYPTVYFIRDNYPDFIFDCDDYEQLYDLMKHDKKNAAADKINFTFLSDIGKIEIDQSASKEDIFESIDFLRESVGL
ncbi:3-dehydroquinate synthase [Dysgonomonas sp. 25]|uniref:3-dehydroquinate synthase n=1 Tax=Dysgonomonas sp. 25 TaxID=2302933 RepID=UPI0013CF842B|nr:3-dehydroquinate synthase [Dysgonomonas sp. 25]NDV69629.1 3-dehydroquinate synthase [Dysgonomonas sp. 25]